MTRGAGGVEIFVRRGMSDELFETVRGFVETAKAEGRIPAFECNLSPDEYAVVATAGDGQVVGVLVFHPVEVGELFVHFAFVAPRFRRKGIYGRLHATLARHAQCVGAATISALTLPDNGPMNRALQKIGTQVVGVYHRQIVGEVT